MMNNNPWILLSDSINSKRCDPNGKFDFFWGLGEKGEYLLIINHEKLEDWPVRRLNLSGLVIEQFKVGSKYRLAIKLLDSSDWDIFLNLCHDLFQVVEGARSEAEMLTLVHNRLHRWQKLLRNSLNGLLTIEEQQGLIGELYFLKEYLLTRHDEIEALSFWQGPYGDSQDFTIGEISLEVKAKRASAQPFVQISSIDQLDTRSDYGFLFVINMNSSTEKNPHSFSLNYMVNEIKSMLCSVNAISIFEDLLLKVGYIDLPVYSEFNFLFVSESFFEIRDSFPRIKHEQLMPGVAFVKYQIDLYACKEFEVTQDDLLNRMEIASVN